MCITSLTFKITLFYYCHQGPRIYLSMCMHPSVSEPTCALCQLDLEGGERADINPQPQSLPPSDSIGRWIVEKYDAAYFARPLKKHDLLCLQAQALSNYQQFGMPYSVVVSLWLSHHHARRKEQVELWIATEHNIHYSNKDSECVFRIFCYLCCVWLKIP